MNINGPTKTVFPLPDASQSALQGIREQVERLNRNVAEVASAESDNSFSPGSRDYALVEQHEIVRAVQANARSLEAANEVVGTILDIKV